MSRNARTITAIIGGLLVIAWMRSNPTAAIVLITIIGAAMYGWRRHRAGGTPTMCQWCREKPTSGRARFCSPRCRAEHRLDQQAMRGDELAARRLKISRIADRATPSDEIPF